MMPSSRILLVDDHEGFRQLVCSMLQQADFQVVGQASDGLQALQKTAEVQPDLILLDIGMPTLNGVETARRLRVSAPHLRILFISQESSPDVVHEALRSGGAGYVLKRRAGTELLPAIKAVLAGRHFVSGGLEVHEVPEPTTARHEVIFYSNDRDFLEILADFIRANMNSGKTAIVVATKSDRGGLIEKLKAERLDGGAILERTYIALDSADTLRAMMVNGVPERARLFESVAGIIDLASKTKEPAQHGIVVCGQCAPLLLAKGEAETAIQVEKLWDEVTQTHAVDLLCAYPMSSFCGGQEDPVFQRICAEHSAVHFHWTSLSAY